MESGAVPISFHIDPSQYGMFPSTGVNLLFNWNRANLGVAFRDRSSAMPDYPSGTVAFLFTDIEGSTKRWETDQQAMWAAVERHDDGFVVRERANIDPETRQGDD